MTKRMIVFLIAFGFLGMMAGHVEAEVTIKAYQEGMKKGGSAKEFLDTYVSGLGRGIWIMNYEAKLFCPPEKFIAQGANFIRWLKDGIEQNKNWSDGDKIEIVLYVTINEVFPCEAK